MGVFTKLIALIVDEVLDELDQLEKSRKGVTTIKLDIAEPSLAADDISDEEIGFGFQVKNDKTADRN